MPITLIISVLQGPVLSTEMAFGIGKPFGRIWIPLSLQWAEGNFPTPFGVLYVKHTKLPNGKINSVIKAPKGIIIVQ